MISASHPQTNISAASRYGICYSDECVQHENLHRPLRDPFVFSRKITGSSLTLRLRNGSSKTEARRVGTSIQARTNRSKDAGG